MDTILPFFYILAGFLLRLAIPITATVLVIFVLRKLDKRWKAEAGFQPLTAEKLECWKVNGCTSEQMRNCPAPKSPLPCWQVKRLPNGYLQEECLTCSIFIDTPAPTLTIEPRSM